MSNNFKVGDEIHGFARGAFGRDSYDCRIVEAIGMDWVVTRNTANEAEMVRDSRIDLAYMAREDRSYCDDICDAKP